MNPKGPCTKIGNTWALKYFLHKDFWAQVYTYKVHGPSGECSHFKEAAMYVFENWSSGTGSGLRHWKSWSSCTRISAKMVPTLISSVQNAMYVFENWSSGTGSGLRHWKSWSSCTRISAKMVPTLISSVQNGLGLIGEHHSNPDYLQSLPRLSQRCMYLIVMYLGPKVPTLEAL